MRVEQQKDGKGAKAPHNATLSLDGQGQRGWTAPRGEAVGDSPLACSTVCQIDSTGKQASELGFSCRTCEELAQRIPQFAHRAFTAGTGSGCTSPALLVVRGWHSAARVHQASSALLVLRFAQRFWWLMYCTASTDTMRMTAIMPTTISTAHHCHEER